MKFVVTNTTLANGGDAAILIALLGSIKRAFGNDAEVAVFDRLADVARRYYPDIDARLPLFDSRLAHAGQLGAAAARLLAERVWLGTKEGHFLLRRNERQILELYRSADAIISTGGTYLVDHYNIRARLLEFELAVRTGKPLVLFTQSLGPFERAEYARTTKPYFEYAKLILLRDERSRKYLLNLGIDSSKLHVLPDCVFSLADLPSPDDLERHTAGIGRVAISVRGWTKFKGRGAREGMDIYKQGVANAATWLARRNVDITFISTCQGIPEYAAKDSDVASEIASSLPPDVRARVVVDQGFHSPTDLQRILRDYDFVIATRMHMAILALSVGVPVLPVAYEFKTEELFAQSLSAGRWVTSIDNMTENSLVELLPDFVEALPSLRPQLAKAVARQRDEAFEADTLLKNAVQT